MGPASVGPLCALRARQRTCCCSQLVCGVYDRCSNQGDASDVGSKILRRSGQNASTDSGTAQHQHRDHSRRGRPAGRQQRNQPCGIPNLRRRVCTCASAIPEWRLSVSHTNPCEELRDFRRAVDLDGIRSLRSWRPLLQRGIPPRSVSRAQRRNTGRSPPLTTSPAIRFSRGNGTCASDTGQPAASGKLGSDSPFNEKGTAMFVVLVPVYRIGLPVHSVRRGSRRSLDSFSVHSAPPTCFSISPRTRQRRSVFEVYDGTRATSVSLLGGPAQYGPSCHIPISRGDERRGPGLVSGRVRPQNRRHRRITCGSHNS